MENSGQPANKPNVTAQLLERIKNMSLDQQSQLLKELDKREKRESRQNHRKNFFMTVDYNVEDQYVRDFIEDMSNGGVFIKTSQTFSVGQKILMTFMSPDHLKPFKIGGEIVHFQKEGFGVKFKTESQVQEEAIKNLVNMIQN
jgi:Tfp pilus assembly protein PilZ